MLFRYICAFVKPKNQQMFALHIYDSLINSKTNMDTHQTLLLSRCKKNISIALVMKGTEHIHDVVFKIFEKKN